MDPKRTSRYTAFITASPRTTIKQPLSGPGYPLSTYSMRLGLGRAQLRSYPTVPMGTSVIYHFGRPWRATPWLRTWSMGIHCPMHTVTQ